MRPQDRRKLRLARVAAIALPRIAVTVCTVVIPPGCGLAGTTVHAGAGMQLIRGRDSAGAIIELARRGADFTAARVIDVVLGTGESAIISDEGGSIEFTIGFPAGVTITYRGRRADVSESDDVLLSGTWRQHPGGVFGEDSGTWEAQDPLEGKP